MAKKNSGKLILNGRAKLFTPTTAYKSYRIVWVDPISGVTKKTSGGSSEEEATAKAAQLLGDYSPEAEAKLSAAPTLQEVFEAWVDGNRHRWSSRTVDNYAYIAGRLLSPFGELPINSITPQQLRTVNTAGISRQQQLKLRSLVRGIFAQASGWIQRDLEQYASAIRISGSSADSRSYEVSRGDVPSARFIHAAINVASSTCQVHPAYQNQDDWGYAVDPSTGEQKIGPREILNPLTGEMVTVTKTVPMGNAFGIAQHHQLHTGLPLEIISSYRRGIPKHYKNVEQRKTDETTELAGRFRQLALVIALGAGGGLRIGEELALRVGHFIPNDKELMGSLFWAQRGQPDGLKRWADLGYRGFLRVQEQASQASKGRIVISRPKHNKERDVWLPSVLYHESETMPLLTMERRTQILSVETGVNFAEFEDPTKSLWEMTDEQSMALWRAGFVPLGWMLFQRLNDLWVSLHPTGQEEPRFADFRRLLLFPTRNKTRANSGLEVPESWIHETGFVEGFGGYQAQTNFAGKLSNPLYDFVSELLDDYPQHRQNRTERKGWTHHGLRHYAATSMIHHKVPLPVISEQLGHASYDFTLKRYVHALRENFSQIGFE